MPNDIGKFVARYLQVLACLSIASMVVTAILFDALHVDFSFLLLFWAAEYLIQHHPRARRWTIGVCGLILVTLVAMLAYAAIAGTQDMTVTLGRRIEHPSLGQVAVVAGGLLVLAGIPFVLLLTPQARREFQRPA